MAKKHTPEAGQPLLAGVEWPTGADKEAPGARAFSKHGVVILVEPQEHFRTMMEETLCQSGYTVESFASHEAAFSRAKALAFPFPRAQADIDEKRPLLAVLARGSKEEGESTGWIKKFRKLDSAVPVIMLTVGEPAALRWQAQEAGAHALLRIFPNQQAVVERLGGLLVELELQSKTDSRRRKGSHSTPSGSGGYLPGF